MTPEGRIVLTSAAGADGPLDVAVTLDRGPLDPATRQSVRVAPPLAGRAALDWIDPAAVLALADPDDRDGDGISGRARMIEVDGTPTLGRYGWKAARPASTSRSPTPSRPTSACRARAARSRTATARRRRATAWPRRPAKARAFAATSFPKR